jgi:hypothetical protein
MSILGKTLAGNSESSRHVLDVLGRRVPVKLIDQGVKVGFARQFYADAVARVEAGFEIDVAAATADRHPPAALDHLQRQHQAELDDLREDYHAGKFDLLSKRGVKALSEPEGIVRLLALLTSLTRAELFAVVRSKEDAAKVSSLISVIIAESFPDELPQQAAPADGAAKKKSPASKSPIA